MPSRCRSESNAARPTFRPPSPSALTLAQTLRSRSARARAQGHGPADSSRRRLWRGIGIGRSSSARARSSCTRRGCRYPGRQSIDANPAHNPWRQLHHRGPHFVQNSSRYRPATSIHQLPRTGRRPQVAARADPGSGSTLRPALARDRSRTSPATLAIGHDAAQIDATQQHRHAPERRARRPLMCSGQTATGQSQSHASSRGAVGGGLLHRPGCAVVPLVEPGDPRRAPPSRGNHRPGHSESVVLGHDRFDDPGAVVPATPMPRRQSPPTSAIQGTSACTRFARNQVRRSARCPPIQPPASRHRIRANQVRQ